MTTISFQALNRLLISNGFRYVIEQAKNWKEYDVYKFVAAIGYPENHPFIINNPPDHAEINAERNVTGRGNILLFYNMDTSSVIGCCPNWQQLIQKEIRNAKSKRIDNSKAIVLASTVA